MNEAAAVLGPVAAVLEEGRAQGVAPGLSAVVLRGDELLHSSIHGHAQVDPQRVPLAPSHLFDVASLTKVMATTTLAALFAKEGQLPLDAPAAGFLPEFAGAGKEAVTLRHLLSHSSGLPWWRPYHELAQADPLARLAFASPGRCPSGRLAEALARSRALVREAVVAEPLEAPPGTRAAYSDCGFMILGWILERIGGQPLDRLCRELVFSPLGLLSTFFIDELTLARSGRSASDVRGGWTFVATERNDRRGEVNCGSVNDDNAWALGGVAGHAGLFSSAGEVALLGRAWLDALQGRSSLLDRRIAEAFCRRDQTPGSTRALGWDTPSEQGSSLGARLGRGSRGAVGHLGFTGCSLWIDLDHDLVAALLTNRCHPSRENQKIRELRPRFHDAVAQALGI